MVDEASKRVGNESENLTDFYHIYFYMLCDARQDSS